MSALSPSFDLSTSIIILLPACILSLPSMSLATGVSTCFCKNLLSGLAPYTWSYPLSITKLFAASVRDILTSWSASLLFVSSIRRSTMPPILFLSKGGCLPVDFKIYPKPSTTCQFINDYSYKVLTISSLPLITNMIVAGRYAMKNTPLPVW